MEIILNQLEQAPTFCQEHKRPLVSLCYAQSLDGSIAKRRGEPTMISGAESSQITHSLRAKHDAILVGVGTILADDPRLTVRFVEGPNPQPVILDSHLRTPPNSNVIQYHPLRPIITTTSQASSEHRYALQKANAHVVIMPSMESGHVQLPALLEHLAKEGINSIMVEGGAKIITNFLAAGLVDQAVITIAPIFMGGLPAIEQLQIGSRNIQKHPESGWPRLKDIGSKWVGGDLIIWGRLGK